MSKSGAPAAVRLSGGANQARVRAHNERLVLSLVRRQSGLSKAEIARQTGLSPQTVTVIMRALEEDGLLLRGQPQRGKVGQPSIPMMLAPDGAYSLGLKIGRRSVDLVLMDFTGQIRGRLRETYPFPQPDRITRFVVAGTANLLNWIHADQRDRVAGLGVAMPFELWNWTDRIGVDPAMLEGWRHFDVVSAFEAATGLDVIVQNDGTAACGAELLFGRGRETANFACFFMGSFVGGGLVIDNKLVTGPSGNAGAMGTIPVEGPDGHMVPLLDCASLHLLEDAVRAAGGNATQVWESPENWSGLGPLVNDWVDTSATHLAQAIISVCSVFDFETIIIDGNLPAQVRGRLVRRTDAALLKQDLSGITRPAVIEGSLGHNAQVMGAAGLQIISRYLVDEQVLFTAPAPG